MLSIYVLPPSLEKEFYTVKSIHQICGITTILKVGAGQFISWVSTDYRLLLLAQAAST